MESSDLDSLKTMMEGLLKPLNEKIDTLANENAVLKEKLRTNMEYAENNLPAHLSPAGIGSLTDSRFARSAVVATRPVQDNPSDPLWGGLVPIDPGLLVQNTLSGGMKGGHE